MPRRRRKLPDDLLKPLVFIESPVNGVPQLPSPVFSSDNPAKADVVPVDRNLTWVSPQFVDIPGTCGKHRKRRKNKISGIKSLNHLCGQHGTHKVKYKYKSLTFLGQGERVCDTISNQEEIKDADDMMVQHDKTMVHLESSDTEGHLPKDVNVLHQEQSSLLQGDYDVKTPDGAATQIDQLLKHSGRTRSFTSIKPRVSKQLDGVVSNLKEKSVERKQLTKKQNMDLECDFDGIPKRRATALCRTNIELFSDYQSQTPEQQLADQVDILVYDTPEEDYGLSVRQRRLKYINR